MAEKVEVDGGGEFNGAILKNAATEATLERLAVAMEAKQKGLGQKILGVATSVINGNIKAQQQSTSAFGSFTQTLNQGTNAGSKLVDVFASIVGTGIGTTFSLLSTAGGAFLDFVKDGYKAFQETSQVGAAFNNDLFELRRTAADALIPLDEFTQLVKKNSETFARLGTSVSNGSHVFANVAGILKEDFGNELVGLGFSLSDLNEGAATYLEVQSRIGRVDQRSSRDLAESTRDYLLELDKITKLTGMSRKAQEDLARKASVDPIIQSMLEGMDKGSEAFKKGQANLAILQEIGGDRAVQYAKELAAMRPGPEAAMFAQQLNMNMEDFLGIIQGETDPQEFVNALKRRRDQTKAMDEDTRKQQRAIMMSSQGFADAYQALQRVEGLGDFDTINTEQQNREKITEALGVFGNTLNTIYNNTIAGLIDSPVFFQLKKKLEMVGDLFTSNSGYITDFFEEVMSGINFSLNNFINNIREEGFTSAIVKLFKDLFTELKIVATPVVQDLLANIFGETPEQKAKRQAFEQATPDQRAKMLQETPEMGQSIPDMFFDKLKEKLSGLLPSFWDIAKFLGIGATGTVVGGMGLALGFKMLGKAMDGVSIPALKLAAAIGLGGAGVGAAFWGISKAVDAVSNSFTKIKDFFIGMQTLDSNKLASVGSAVKPLTSSLSELASTGIKGLIAGGGLENLAVSLVKFNDINTDQMEKVGPALKVLYDGVSLFSGGGILESVSNAISSFFSGQSISNIAQTVSQIGNIDVNERAMTSTINFVEALSKFTFLNLNNVNFDPFINSIVKLTNNLENTTVDKTLNTIKTSIDSFEVDTSVFDSTTNSIGKLKEVMDTFQIDPTKFENAVSAIGQLKTTMSDGFTIESKGVDEFNKSIKNLVETLSALEEQMKKTSSTTVNVGGEIGSGRKISPTEIAGNTPEDMQRQLNMKIDELISHIVEMKQNTKDTADAISDRRNAV